MKANYKWREVLIPEVLYFQEGPGVRNTQFRETGVKLLNVGNINNGVINLTSTKTHLSEEEAYGKYSHFLVDDGDLLIACSGIIVENFHNKIAFASSEHLPLCLNTSTMRFKPLNKSNIDILFFKYYLQTEKFKSQLVKLITGSAQLNFGPSHIKKIKLPLPPLPQQQKIANILDAADVLRQNDKALIAKYDELTQALFLDMFGDPVSNPKGWNQFALKHFGKISTGNTPSRSDDANYSTRHIEWIKTDNIKENNLYITQASEYLSEVGLKKARTVEKDAILVACIAGSIDSIGRAALTDRKVSFNQQINAIESNSNVRPKYLYYLIRNCKKHIQNHASNGMKRMLTKGEFEKILMILPSLELQNQFAERVTIIEEQIAIAQKSLDKSESLFNSLLQKAFKGDLV